MKGCRWGPGMTFSVVSGEGSRRQSQGTSAVPLQAGQVREE